ncbi:MAG: hypothetical protein M3092_05160 [Actinomycetia bacterium]|nr:hypothetical protein [Actinomycetes bacterium]
MKKLIATTAAAGVLVAGAFVASTVTTNPADAQVPDSITEQQDTTQQERPDRGAIFDEVLEGLVADGTIDSGQADAIKEAFEAKRDEIAEEFGPRPERGQEFHRGALRGLLADDVITQAEIDALPEDHPLRTGVSPLSELLEDDGQITREELEAFKDANPRPPRSQDGVAG